MGTIINRDTSAKDKTLLEHAPLVQVTRLFNAPVERVWNAWTDSELVKQWWGPEGFTCPNAEIDFRMGGKYFLAMQDPSGKVVWSSGIYKEIDPLKKIICTDYFSDESGNIISASEVGMPGEWPLECIMTVEFRRVSGGQTEMTIKHQGIPKEMHDDCVDGWNSSINILQSFLHHH